MGNLIQAFNKCVNRELNQVLSVSITCTGR
jgi:hypothetical protein